MPLETRAEKLIMKPALGIFLNLGDSFNSYRLSGRDTHWLNNYLRFYPKFFKPVYVFSYANEPNPYPELITLLPNRFNLPRWLYTWLLPWFYRKELRICRVFRVKQMLGVWPALIAKLVWRIPVVSTYGYDYAHFAKKEGLWWLVPLIRIIEWCGLRFSDQIIVTLPSGRPRTNLIPNGVDIDLFKPGKRSPGKELKILTVGRLVHQKNQLNLLRAIAKLSRPVELTLVGRGPLKTKIFELAKKFKVKLQYIESASHLDLAKIYQAADIFCLASHHEGSPKALLEAMSCGLPCVVADKPYSRFIITSGRDGLLVQNSPDALARGINKIIASPVLAGTLEKNARQTILKRFDNKKIIQQEINLLTSFLPL